MIKRAPSSRNETRAIKTLYRTLKKVEKRIVIKERFCLLLAGQPPVTTRRIVSLSELTAPSRGTAFPPFNTSTVS